MVRHMFVAAQWRSLSPSGESGHGCALRPLIVVPPCRNIAPLAMKSAGKASFGLLRASSLAVCAGVRITSVAARLSLSCFIVRAPTMVDVTPGRPCTQAIATRDGVVSSSFAIRASSQRSRRPQA